MKFCQKSPTHLGMSRIHGQAWKRMEQGRANDPDVG